MAYIKKSRLKTKAKLKRLPKDFGQLLEKGNMDALEAVFDRCDLDARGGYSKGTALMFFHCPEEFARWFVAQGADLAAVDAFGNTALHAQARNRGGCVEALIELGADVHANTSGSGTPLHCAVDAKHAAHVAVLLAHGANVNVTNREQLTPLEYGLQRTSNIELESMAEVARIMLSAGAINGPACQAFVKKLGERFEFHRADFNQDGVEAASNALDALYELFGVEPVPRRKMHDGKTLIKVRATDWRTQFQELWEALVPPRGAAATVQGEVIRITGRISDEINGNGGANWDRDYKKMAEALCEHVRTGTPLPAEPLAECEAAVRSVIKNRDGDVDKLIESAVRWVLLNPKPIELPKPAYAR